jgi:hypothetical protein
MLSTALEATGLAVITAGTTAGAYALAGLGVALLVFGVVGGVVLVLVGYLLAVSASNGRQ